MKSGNIYYIVIYKKETCKLQIYNITVHSFYKTHYSPQYFCSFHISFNTMQAMVVVVWTLIQDIDAGIFFNFISINRKKKRLLLLEKTAYSDNSLTLVMTLGYKSRIKQQQLLPQQPSHNLIKKFF